MASDRSQWWPCTEWLLRCLKDMPEIQHQAQEVLAGPDATVGSLLSSLQDGVLLCCILPALSCGRIDLDSLEGFKKVTLNSTFVFKKNINIFLCQCASFFQLKKSELFSADDLIGQENIAGILRCLSLLSRSSQALRSGIAGFQLPTADESEYYCPPDICRPQMTLDDTVYSIDFSHDDKLYETLIEQPRKPHEKRQSGLTKKQLCQQEFVETEQHYVDTLHALHDNVYRLLLDDCSKSRSAWSRDEVEEIFRYIPDLLKLHQKILEEMRINIMLKNDDSESLPEVLLRYRHELLLYGKYCVHVQKAQKLVEHGCRCDRAKSAELQRLLDQNEARFKLSEYLTVPIQRVLRYHLLIGTLKDIEKKAGSRRLPQLLEAHAAMLEVASHINEVKRDVEEMSLIDQIQNNIEDLELPANMRLINYGRLRADGELKVVPDPSNQTPRLGGSKLRYCFLLSKLCMIVRSKSQGREGYTFKDVFPIDADATFEELDAGSGRFTTRWVWMFKVVSKGRPFHFLARTAELRRFWLDAFRKAHDDCYPTRYNCNGRLLEPCTFQEPSYCSVCDKLLLGCFQQGYKCSRTGMQVHKACIPAEAVDMPDGRGTTPPGYVGKMSHGDASATLNGQPSGTFLVRRGTSGLVISLSFGSAVKHMRIINPREGAYHLSELRTFSDPNSLILHYMQHPLSECFDYLDTTLRQPYSPRTSRRSASISTSTPKQTSVIAAGVALRNFQDPGGKFSLAKGERVSLLERHSGLWRCRKSNGQVGLLPVDAVRPMSTPQ